MTLARWLWEGRSALARAMRAILVPPSLLYRGVMALRAGAYRRGLLRARALPLPAVAVGNLAVGGTGKTPVAAWIAAFLAERGERPGILLRGYGGGDEALVHGLLTPGAIVVPDPDRHAGAARARAAGATVLVLDDAFQRLDVERDANIALISAESAAQSPWPLPAGPWREGWRALERADLLIVTRRVAGPEDAVALAERLAPVGEQRTWATAHLALDGFAGLRTGGRMPLDVVTGKRVVVAAGIADPASFAGQIGRLRVGAIVQLVAYQDHHPYSQRDIDRLAQAARSADYVVVTQKDAVKLRDRWPADAPEPLVAEQAVRWEMHGEAVIRVLERLLPRTL